MLIRDHDRPIDDAEWRAFVESNAFGHLIAAGRDRDVPVVVPTQFVLDESTLWLHLAKPNPIWSALAENPHVVLSIAGDWAFVPSAWKAIDDEDPRRGVPTTYYAAVQLIGTATVLDEADDVASVLRRQLADQQPDVDAIDPADHGAMLRGIRGVRVDVLEVRAKFKYGGNVDDAHKRAVIDRLDARAGAGDRVAAQAVARRLGPAADGRSTPAG